LEAEIARITPKWVDLLKALTPQALHPRRSDVQVTLVGLAWVPAWLIAYADGDHTLFARLPAFVTSKRLR
jgi:hypothetical protein